MEAKLSRQHLKVLRKTTEAATMFTLRSSPQHFFFGREPNTQQTAVRMNLTIAANVYPFQVKFKCGQQFSSIGADMGGQHQQWGCVGDAISRNTRSIIIGWTHEDLWLRVYRKSVVAVPVEVAPRAQRCRVKGQITFDRISQPQANYLTRFSIYFIRSCWREAAQILLYRNSSASKFYYPIIYALHRWTQFIISNQSSQLF